MKSITIRNYNKFKIPNISKNYNINKMIIKKLYLNVLIDWKFKLKFNNNWKKKLKDEKKIIWIVIIINQVNWRN